jgi:hypothetical protein
MNRLIGSGILLIGMIFFLSPALQADPKSDLVSKQKTLAAENIKKVKPDSSKSYETPNLIICGTLPEKQLKSIGDQLQKQFTYVHKALKFGKDDKDILGKLAVYCFTNKREYASFIRLVRTERAESDQTYSYDVSGENCSVALVADGSGNQILDPEVGATLGVALLERKAGTDSLPPWVTTSFRKAVAMRVDPKFGDATRKEIRAIVVPKTKPSSVEVKDAWEGDSPDKLLIGASLIDYVAFGTDSSKFLLFLGGFRPSEDRPMPAVQDAMNAAGWKEAELDKAWKTWIVRGK